MTRQLPTIAIVLCLAEGLTYAVAFPNAETLDSRQTARDAQGRSRRIQLLRTDFKYPLVRQEEQMVLDPVTGQDRTTGTVSMVADHIIVMIQPGKTEADLRAVLDRRGGRIAKRIGTSRSFIVKLGQQTLEAVPEATTALKQEAVVAAAEPDYLVSVDAVIPNDPDFGQLFGMNNTGQTGGTLDADIDAPEAWELATGSRDIVVGVIDTGIDYRHPDLEDNIWLNQYELKVNGGDYPPGLTDSNGNGKIDAHELLDFMGDYDQSGSVNLADLFSNQSGTNPFLNAVDEDGNGKINDFIGWNFVSNNNNPLDDNLHGTHVAGTIGATGSNGVGVVGVNWRVSLAALKFLGSDGTGSTSDAIEAVQYSNQMGMDLTNNSWGGGGPSTELKAQIDLADSLGILFVAAAGNSGVNNDDWLTLPASYDSPNIIAVAATDHNDALAQWESFGSCVPVVPGSNFGPTTVDLAAPGKSIWSTFPIGITTYCGVSTQHYQFLSGTSMAAPHVSGACALLKSAQPSFDHMQIKSLVLETVDSIPALEGITVSGGRLNLHTLLNVDRDGDGVYNWLDNCPDTPNADQADSEGDGVGDACDNCPLVSNPGQENCDPDDPDPRGNACDTDDYDDDGFADNVDNCPCIWNPDQADFDGDGYGNLCDPTPSSLFDYNLDGAVDGRDFAELQLCGTITWDTCPSECKDYSTSKCTLDCVFPDLHCEDKDVDGDGNLLMMEWPSLPGSFVDFRHFAACASGPAILADASCGDCNRNGAYDAAEITAGLLADSDGDFVPDMCDACPDVDDLGPDCEPGGESLMGGDDGLLAGGDSGGTDGGAGAESDGDGGMDPLGGLDTTGLATAVSLSVVGNPYPGPYVSSRTESVGFAGAFVIWTHIESNGDMDGLEYRLRVNGGADDALFEVVGYAQGPLSVWDPSLDGYGDMFTLFGPPDGFAPGDYFMKHTPPVTLEAVGHNEVVFNMTAWVAAEAFPGTLLGYVIEPVAPLEAGNYVFSAGGIAEAGGEALWIASPLYGATSDNDAFTLQIVEQP